MHYNYRTREAGKMRIDGEFYILEDAAKLTRLQAVTLRKRCASGEFGRKIGKQWILTREECHKLEKEGYRHAGRPKKSERE